MIPKEDQDLLDRVCPEWMKEIDLNGPPLLAELKKRGVIDPMEIGLIMAERGNHNQVQKLVDTLRRGKKGKNTLDYVIDALHASGYEELAKNLRPTRVDDNCVSEVDGGQASAVAVGGASSASPPLEVLVSEQPLVVKVTPCTKKFRSDNRDKAYPMEKAGVALIISPKKFDRPNLKEIKGADVDRQNLCQLFDQLDIKYELKTEVAHDLTAKGIEANVKAFAQDSDKLKEASCLVFVISSHGKSGDEVYGTDGETVSVQNLFDYFRNCPELEGKPKLFLVNACRGKMRLDVSSLKPEDLDEIIGFATQEEYVAKYSAATGSWFITAVVKVFMEMACKMDVEAMLEEVKRSSELQAGSLKQRPEILPNLDEKKKWFLFP